MSNTQTSVQAPAHDTFFSAADLKSLMEKKSQAKEAEENNKAKEAEAARDALLEELRKPVEISEEKVEEAVQKFRVAAGNGLTEMVVFTFPASLCDDKGRKIANALEGWQDSLIGKPRSIYEAWEKYLKDKGYQLHGRVVDYQHGMINDLGLVVIWAQKEQ